MKWSFPKTTYQDHFSDKNRLEKTEKKEKKHKNSTVTAVQSVQSVQSPHYLLLSKTGIVSLNIMLMTINKVIENNSKKSRINILNMTENKSLPTYIIHGEKVVSNEVKVVISSSKTASAVGLGLVFDGNTKDHHYTLLVKLFLPFHKQLSGDTTSGGSVLFNTNGADNSLYKNVLLKHNWQYVSYNLQGRITKTNGCGIAVILLVKWICELLSLMSLDDISFSFRRIEYLIEKLGRFDRKPKLEQEYLWAIQTISDMQPNYDTLGSVNNCSWCK